MIKNALSYSGDTTAYKLYRNKILMLTRIIKKTYQENMVGINRFLDRKQEVLKDKTSLKCPTSNKVSFNSSEFPDITNKYFSSIGHDLASKMPKPTQKISRIFAKDRCGWFLLFPFNVSY